MASKSLLRKYPIPETKGEVINWLQGENPSKKQSFPYWDNGYGKCYFRRGKKTIE